MDRRKTDVGPTGVRQSDKHHCQGGPTLASRAGRYERVRSFLLLERLVLLLPRRLTVIRKKMPASAAECSVVTFHVPCLWRIH